ncbi:MAG: hypothetical protein FWF51_11160 [Chitinivibrionia bacterium]|nr:hypothetical protein [Chitinivibrionia bacterium]
MSEYEFNPVNKDNSELEGQDVVALKISALEGKVAKLEADVDELKKKGDRK